MTFFKINGFIVAHYFDNYFFFTEEYEFVFFSSEKNLLKLLLDPETEKVDEKIDPVILEDVYRYMANPLGL